MAMQMKKYKLIDPTGGGDDGEMTLPVWARPYSGELAIEMPDGEMDVFEIVEEDEEDDE